VREVKPLERGGNVKTIIMKGVKHYTKDGKEWEGKSHKMDDGKLHTGATHNKSSELLVHEKDVKRSGFKLREVNSPMQCWKTHKKVGTKPSPTRPGVTVNDCVKK